MRTAFHAYTITHHARVNNNSEVKAIHLDSEFYDSKYLTFLHAHNLAYVMPIIGY